MEWKQKERRKYKALKMEQDPKAQPYDFAKELKKLPKTDARGIMKQEGQQEEDPMIIDSGKGRK